MSLCPHKVMNQSFSIKHHLLVEITRTLCYRIYWYLSFPTVHFYWHSELPACREGLFKTRWRHSPASGCLKMKDVDFVSSVKASKIVWEEQCALEEGRCRRPAVTHSPVDGWWASLGFTAEHHLPVLLHSLHRIHNAARLLAEDRTLQDTALCGTTRKKQHFKL